MRIAIDISQIAHQGTGVANYTQNLVENLLKIDRENEYVLFFSSLRRKPPKFYPEPNVVQGPNLPNFQIKTFKIPPTLLEFLWNTLHIFPIEWFVGPVDVYLSSDWIQAPSKAKKVTTIHDLIPFKYPQAMPKKIVKTHQRRMRWVKSECDSIICDSQSTKNDVMKILGIEEERLRIIYPGVNVKEAFL